MIPRPMRRQILGPLVACSLGAGLLVAAPRAAWSQEAPTVGGGEQALVRWRVGVEVAAAHFRLDAGSGQYLTTTPFADVTLRGKLSIRLSVPLADLALDGLARREGIGDVSLRMKVRLFETERWLVQASVTAELPTGETSLGMSNGAPTLTPLVTAGYEVGDFILFLTLSDAFSLRAHGAPPANFIEPSTDQELIATAGANWRISRGIFALLTATPIIPLLAADRAHPFFYATPVLGWSSPIVRLSAGVGIPIAGTFRFDERAFVNALFSIP